MEKYGVKLPFLKVLIWVVLLLFSGIQIYSNDISEIDDHAFIDLTLLTSLVLFNNKLKVGSEVSVTTSLHIKRVYTNWGTSCP